MTPGTHKANGGARGEAHQVVIVSNRLPISLERRGERLAVRRSSGGLVSALEPVLARRGGTWVGWPGAALDEESSLPQVDFPYQIVPVRLDTAEVTGFYHGFANSTLWPLFHGFTTRTRFEAAGWAAYRNVNERFAVAAAAAGRSADLIWVHDYQLMLTPQRLRERARSRLAFFLHIPFPPFDLFRLLPWDRELLHGLLACDLIGFHIDGYVRNFLDCVERLLGARVDYTARLVEYGGRTVQVGAFPLGIDFALYESRARAAPPGGAPAGVRVVLGVDRLDYTKGIPERLRAFERLLELHPEHRERVILLQLAVPSRSEVPAYRRQKRQIDELVGRINGRFATPNWSPIHYLHRGTPPDHLVQLYRDAHVALVTPLRDGMNLVAKEFVACQVGDPGVLVLSRFAGASETMREAIRVNPYNIDATADAVHLALNMSEAERRSRMTGLRWRERTHNVFGWVEEFVRTACAGQVDLRPPSPSDFEAWIGTRLAGHRIALFLDYDGTLVPIRDRPEDAAMNAETRRALRACIQRPDLDVAVISGRALDDLRRTVGERGVTYAGNHGLEIAMPGEGIFRPADLVHFTEKMATVADQLGVLTAEGAWIERKGPTLTLHVRRVDPERRAAVVERAHAIIAANGLQPRDALCSVEARPPIGWDKGQAVLHIVRQRYGPAWSEELRIVYLGDDATDEDAFRVLAGLGFTFRVGSADTITLADRRLSGPDAVRALLEWLAGRPPLQSALTPERSLVVTRSLVDAAAAER